MYEIGIDAGKKSSYIVTAKDGAVCREGYVDTGLWARLCSEAL